MSERTTQPGRIWPYVAASWLCAMFAVGGIGAAFKQHTGFGWLFLAQSAAVGVSVFCICVAASRHEERRA